MVRGVVQRCRPPGERFSAVTFPRARLFQVERPFEPVPIADGLNEAVPTPAALSPASRLMDTPQRRRGHLRAMAPTSSPVLAERCARRTKVLVHSLRRISTRNRQVHLRAPALEEQPEPERRQPREPRCRAVPSESAAHRHQSRSVKEENPRVNGGFLWRVICRSRRPARLSGCTATALAPSAGFPLGLLRFSPFSSKPWSGGVAARRRIAPRRRPVALRGACRPRCGLRDPEVESSEKRRIGSSMKRDPSREPEERYGKTVAAQARVNRAVTGEAHCDAARGTARVTQRAASCRTNRESGSVVATLGDDRDSLRRTLLVGTGATHAAEQVRPQRAAC